MTNRLSSDTACSTPYGSWKKYILTTFPENVINNRSGRQNIGPKIKNGNSEKAQCVTDIKMYGGTNNLSQKQKHEPMI
jgi:hypothetical protein